MLCVIGCGNSTRSDDGVGPFVAQTLKRRLMRHPNPEVCAFDAGTGGMDVMFHARGADRLILIDAAKSGSDAGAVFRVPGSELESDADPGYSLHDFRWQHALAAGRKIFGARFPPEVTVFLVEAGTLEFGLELSEPVRRSALRVVEDIETMIQQYSRRHQADRDDASCSDQEPRGADLPHF
jgi:hydrogenase maturation protease